MKKLICSLLIVAILMNFIVSSISYADGQIDGTQSQQNNGLLEDATPSDSAATDIIYEGEVNQNNGSSSGAKAETSNDMGGLSMIGAVLGYLALMLDIIPLQLHLIFSMVTTSSVVASDGSDKLEFWVSIERIVFNKIPLFNINYFNDKDEYTVGTGSYKETITASQENKDISKSVSKMYIIMRLLSITIALLVLIYIGIRMALSTVASDKAKYKKMLMSWVESMVILFMLVPLMVIIINFGNILTNVFYSMKCMLQAGGGESFEHTILNKIYTSIFEVSGMQLATYSLMYWILVYTHVKFLFMYMKRTLIVAFLIMIAPLITITYPIDKAGDGRAQAFNKWLSEFLMNVLIQPLHAIIYLVFMFTAGELASYAPMLGLIFMLSLGTVEKWVLRIFKGGKATSIGGLNDFKPKK